jgi:FtsZ-binding cell division protein ZapB
MDTNASDVIIALPSKLEGEQVKRLFDDLVESRRINDLLRDEVNTLKQNESAANAKLEALLADLKKYKVFSDGLRIEELREEVDSLKGEVARLHGARKPGSKQIARLAKLDQLLLSRNNVPMTFAEIGKILELGSRSPDGKRSTRRQNMTLLGKTLESLPDRFEVFNSKTQNGRMVRLTREYFQHLMRVNQGV